jgi:hypothetical protein
VRIEEFQGKIAAVRAAGRECELLVVARTEASIADLGLRRGAEAGSGRRERILFRARSPYGWPAHAGLLHRRRAACSMRMNICGDGGRGRGYV